MQFRLTSFHKESAFSATAHSENSESGRLSYFIQFFVWFHIVCDRYASNHAHLIFSTSFDHFHFHGFLKSKRMGLLKSCHKLIQIPIQIQTQIRYKYSTTAAAVHSLLHWRCCYASPAAYVYTRCCTISKI